MGGRGSSSGIGQAHGAGLKQQPDLDHSPSLQAALIKEENRTRDFKNEQMTVWDKNGEQVIHRRGKSGSVSYSTSEAQMYFYGATITHNHPHGDDRGGLSTTLSIPDVEPFRFGLKEMRASGAEGTYVLRNKNWNNKADKGYEFYLDTPTNQKFVIMTDEQLERIKGKIEYGFWEKPDQKHTVICLATSWSTTDEVLDKLAEAL